MTDGRRTTTVAAVSDPDRRHRRHQCALLRSCVDADVRRRSNPQIVQTADFATIDDAIHAAILERRRSRPNSAVLAVAGPVDGDEIPLTNCPWVVKPRSMLATISALSDIVVLNDFEAQALAVVALGEEHMEKIGGGAPEAGAGRVVLGPGTGLGVAGLIHALRPLDPGARRRRPHGHRPAHAARFRDLPAYRDDRGPHFRRADPVRPRPGQHLPRRRQGRRQAGAASPRRPRSPPRRWPRPTRSPRKRWRCSSPASGAPPAISRWCSRAAAASS